MKPLSGTALSALFVITLATMVLSLGVGRFAISPNEVAQVLTAHILGRSVAAPPNLDTVLMMVRLPRIWGAALVGSSLSVAGVSYQTVFRNPMVSPSLLGVSAGAGCGAAVALLLAWPWGAVQSAAFVGGMLTVAIAMLVHRLLGGRSVVTLVLCGLVVAAFFEALLSLMKSLADPLEVLPGITFWLLGSLEKVTVADVRWATVPMLCCALLVYTLRWRSAALAIGDDEAISLGVSVGRTRLIVIAAATLMVAIAVSLAGIIGWVGLIVPHAARMLFGLSPTRLYPAAGLMGATFLVLIDDLARSGLTTEMPLGALTAMIGAPLFLVLLTRLKNAAWT